MTAEERLSKVDQIIAEIYMTMAKPGWKELTNAEMKVRADNRRTMANGLKLGGINNVKEEYR